MSGKVGGAGSKSGVVSDRTQIYAHLDDCSTSYGDMTFSTLEGDSTNITQDGASVTLVKPGIYTITCCWNWNGGNAIERGIFGFIDSVSGSRGTDRMSIANDQLAAGEQFAVYGGATGTFSGYFVGGDTFKFRYNSGDGASATNRADTHASIFKLSR
jgi:hypothetical protein